MYSLKNSGSSEETLILQLAVNQISANLSFLPLSIRNPHSTSQPLPLPPSPLPRCNDDMMSPLSSPPVVNDTLRQTAG